MENWKRDFAKAFRKVEDLLEFLELDPTLAHPSAHRIFNTLVPLSFAERMEKGNPKDPLLLQILPTALEEHEVPGFSNDPVLDLEFKKSKSLIQKYSSRVLSITTGACAVHCRYCFRRNFPYSSSSRQLKDFLQELQQPLAPEVDEIILSGGDPLSLETEALAQIFETLEGLPQIKTLRIHTRIPIVLPSRIDTDFCTALQKFSGAKVIVVHANHPNEFNSETAQALDKLRPFCQLLNQFVLLKGINDSAYTLASLCKKGFEQGVLPYYLNQLDKAQGTAHFEVDDETALALLKKLGEKLPGYLLPRLVRDIPGQKSKTQLSL